MTQHRITEIRDPQGGRNFIRAGDIVSVAPGPSDRTSFLARFQYADVDANGEVIAITVVGGRGFDPLRSQRAQSGRCEWRVLRPQRVRRKSQAPYIRAAQ